MSDSIQTSAALRQFDGKPSFKAAFPQAMQHVLAMLIGNITPPMLIAGTCGLTVEEKIMLTQAAMIIGGITTLLQLFPVFGFGMKLPNVMGVAFAYMPILTIIGQQYGIAAIFGSQLVAGFVSIFIGMFIGKIRRFFPPIVSGTVVMSIGLSLYKTAISYIGGGTAACEEAMYLANIAESVTMVVRRDRFRAPKGIVDKVLQTEGLDVRYETSIVSVEGDKAISRIAFMNNRTKDVAEETFEEGSVGVFVFAGTDPAVDLVTTFVDLGKDGGVVTDEDMATKTPGLFCAGDIRSKHLRQVITAASDGAIAGMSAYRYLNG